jgi:hypothetical protein
VALYVNTFFEKRVEQLFDLAGRVEAAFAAAGLEYRVIGGLAVYLYVEEAEPDAGRLTRDIDIAVRREDLDRIARAVEPYGMRHKHVAGVDMLVQEDVPSARRAVHLIFTGEKVKADYPEAAPAIGPCRMLHGVRLLPLADYGGRIPPVPACAPTNMDYWSGPKQSQAGFMSVSPSKHHYRYKH